MRILQWAKDGGKESHVSGLYVVEIKPLFSIVLLHFRNGTREAYHSHAFNALTLWLKGQVIEERIYPGMEVEETSYKAGQWKVTRRDNLHRVKSLGDTWALSIRGPWVDTWREFKNGKFFTLTHGRKVVE